MKLSFDHGIIARLKSRLELQSRPQTPRISILDVFVTISKRLKAGFNPIRCLAGRVFWISRLNASTRRNPNHPTPQMIHRPSLEPHSASRAPPRRQFQNGGHPSLDNDAFAEIERLRTALAQLSAENAELKKEIDYLKRRPGSSVGRTSVSFSSRPDISVLPPLDDLLALPFEILLQIGDSLPHGSPTLLRLALGCRELHDSLLSRFLRHVSLVRGDRGEQDRVAGQFLVDGIRSDKFSFVRRLEFARLDDIQARVLAKCRKIRELDTGVVVSPSALTLVLSTLLETAEKITLRFESPDVQRTFGRIAEFPISLPRLKRLCVFGRPVPYLLNRIAKAAPKLREVTGGFRKAFHDQDPKILDSLSHHFVSKITSYVVSQIDFRLGDYLLDDLRFRDDFNPGRIELGVTLAYDPGAAGVWKQICEIETVRELVLQDLASFELAQGFPPNLRVLSIGTLLLNGLDVIQDIRKHLLKRKVEVVIESVFPCDLNVMAERGYLYEEEAMAAWDAEKDYWERTCGRFVDVVGV